MEIISLFKNEVDEISINELLLLIHHFKNNYKSINYFNFTNNLRILLCLSYYYYMLTSIILIFNYLKKYKNSELFNEFNILLEISQEFYKINIQIITNESNKIFIELIKSIITNNTNDINFNELSENIYDFIKKEYFLNLNYFIVKNVESSILTYNLIFNIILTILLKYKINDTYYNNYYSNIILSLNFEFDENIFFNLFNFGKNICEKKFYNQKYVNNFYLDTVSKNKNINILLINNEYILINFYLDKLNENPNKTIEIIDKINYLKSVKKECELKYSDILEDKNTFIKNVMLLIKKKKFLSNNLCDYKFCNKKYLIKDIMSEENIFQLFVRYYSSANRFLIKDQTILSLYNFINGVLLYKYITLTLKKKLNNQTKKNIRTLKKNIKIILNNNKESILNFNTSFKYLF